MGFDTHIFSARSCSLNLDTHAAVAASFNPHPSQPFRDLVLQVTIRPQNRVVSPGRFPRARQPSPCEEQALRHPLPSSDLAHPRPPAPASLRQSATSRPCSTAVGARSREPSHPSLRDFKPSPKITPFATTELPSKAAAPERLLKSQTPHSLHLFGRDRKRGTRGWWNGGLGHHGLCPCRKHARGYRGFYDPSVG
jgi:hypothetical protein